ncbi:MAG: hypothetical protein LAT55_12165 [Opitutales bacterium]|nr:hypothetical protein [Opitutales bacterium]
MAKLKKTSSSPLTFNIEDSLLQKLNRLQKEFSLGSKSNLIRSALAKFDSSTYKGGDKTPQKQISVRLEEPLKKKLLSLSKKRKVSLGKILRDVLSDLSGETLASFTPTPKTTKKTVTAKKTSSKKKTAARKTVRKSVAKKATKKVAAKKAVKKAVAKKAAKKAPAKKATAKKVAAKKATKKVAAKKATKKVARKAVKKTAAKKAVKKTAAKKAVKKTAAKKDDNKT